MSRPDPRLPPALQGAVQRILHTAAQAAERTTDGLGISALSAGSTRMRDAFLAAQFELNRRRAVFSQRFGEVLVDKIVHDVAPRAGARATTTDWHNLSLVQDDEVEELVTADRLGQAISQECEWELREISAFMGTVLRTGRAALEQNPLRPELIGKALFRALEAVSTERDTRALLMREMGLSMAKAMRQCYTDIVADLQARGIQPVGLTVKGVEGPGNDLPRETLRQNSAYDTLPPEDSRFDAPYEPEAGPRFHGRHPAGGSGGFQASRPGGFQPSRPGGFDVSRPGDARHALRTPARHGRPAEPYAADGVDPYMADLIRRLAALTHPLAAPGPAGYAAPSARAAERVASPGSMPGAYATSGPAAHGGPSSGFGAAAPGIAPASSGLPLIAPNLIRAHRDELRQAATGALDHLVIDVVGSLFDHVLSDPKVPPQMARQIARLQLPVLRVALGDVSFFSSRRHPVRRFVNRIASLACAYDSLSDGRGSEFLGRVRDLVQEIVEGDFDRMEVYEAQLAALEDYVGEQADAELRQHEDSPTGLLHSKESELRVQQRYMQILSAGLAPLPMPEFIREFLAQTWSRVITLAAHSGGPQGAPAKRFRLAGRELAMSVQPKGSPTHRKHFLVKLPQLMKDLNEGLDLIGWSAEAKKGFMARLMPAQTESLRGQPLSELAYNLMAGEIDAILSRTMPEAGELPQGELAKIADVPLDDRFSPDEARTVGLVPEAAVDWEGAVQADAAAGSDEITLPGDIGLPIEGLPPGDPPEPSRGAELMPHLQIGFAYQMELRGAWQKVRLSHISPGRAFFVFTRGHRNEETISMTARMVSRLCETGRLRAFENAYLLERATARARRQLAAMRPE